MTRRGHKRSARNKRSSSHGELASRSIRDWTARGSLALGLSVLAYLGTTSSLAHVITKVDPARAYALAPSNGVIIADYAQSAFTRTPTGETDSLPALLARQALRSDPTAIEALTVLGFQAQLRGDSAQTDQIFSYSIDLSRRELRPRMWAIEEAVTRGDIAAALRQYDVALRTSFDSAELLFPTLTAALAEPRVRSDLLSILATRPVWEDRFVAYAANSGIEPQGAIALFREAASVGVQPDPDLRASLVNSLLSKGKVDEAWSYYRTFRPDVRRDRSRDPQFLLEANNRAAFDWRTGTEAGLSVAILREGESGVLDFSVPPSTGGTLVSQSEILPPGTYHLKGRSRGLDQPDRSRPYWKLTCSDGRELGRVPLPNSNQNGGRFTGRFIVPQDCADQTLSLIARSTDDIMGVSGQIERVQLQPED